jgi:SAM-dependent methyltransferase
MTLTDDIAAVQARLDSAADEAWLLAAVTRLLLRGEAARDDLDRAAARLAAAAGVVVPGGDMALAGGRALRSQLAQLLALADPNTPVRWDQLDDATLLAQGRASSMNAVMWLMPDSPFPAVRDALTRTGAAFLDVGTGVGAICGALCARLPELRCVGLDISPRPLALADRELTALGVRDRVELREQDVARLDDVDMYDVAWIPLPLLPVQIVEVAVERVVRALKPGGVVIAAANRQPGDEHAAAMATLQALTVGGNPAFQEDVKAWLARAGAVDLVDVPTPPMAPAIVVAKRAA